MTDLWFGTQNQSEGITISICVPLSLGSRLSVWNSRSTEARGCNVPRHSKQEFCVRESVFVPRPSSFSYDLINEAKDRKQKKNNNIKLGLIYCTVYTHMVDGLLVNHDKTKQIQLQFHSLY